MLPPGIGLLRVVGTGLDSASLRLSKLSGETWLMKTMSMAQFDPIEFASTFAATNEKGIGVIFGVPGVAFVVFFPAKNATIICRAFLGKEYQAAGEKNAMAEIANIVANALADAIGDATGDILLLTAPRVVEGGRSDIMSKTLETFRSEGWPSPIVGSVQMAAENLAADCILSLLMTSEVRLKLDAAVGGSKS